MNDPRIPKALWTVVALALGLRIALITISHCVEHGDVVHPADYADCRQYNQFGMWFANGMQPTAEVLPHRDRLLPFVLGLVFRLTGRSIRRSSANRVCH